MTAVEILEQLQANDTEYLRVKKELDELPEAKQIVECRSRRRDLKGKQDQVVELSDDAQAKMTVLQREEEQVIAKINSLQEKLDTSSDYRVTQAAQRDMEGQVRRQSSISGEMDDLLERQIQIDKLADQVADMLEKLDAKEEKVTSEFKRKGGELKDRLSSMEGERETLLGELDPSLAAKYEKIREEKGGIAVSRLEGDHCSVCCTTLPVAQLARLRQGPALAECPNCRRIMVTHDEDGEA